MKIIEKKTVIEQISKLVKNRKPWDREIDYIEVTNAEWDQLLRELNPLCFYGIKQDTVRAQVLGVEVKKEVPAITFKFNTNWI